MRIPLQEWRQSRNLTLVVVTVALVLDTLLTTVIVPMYPDFLKRLQDSDAASNADSLLPSSAAPHGTEFIQQGTTTEYIRSSGEGTTDDNLSKLSAKIGVLMASKTLVEMISNPFFGKIADQFGYTIVMFVGFFVTFSSTLIFAFAESYCQLLIARSVQGLGSAALFAPGIGLLADKFPDERERSKAIAIAYGGLILGLVIGPTFGGIMYQFYGKTLPFLILAAVALVDGCLRAFIAEPKRVQREKGPTMKELLSDPYILVNLGGTFFMAMNFAVMEPLLPVWMMETMNANSAQQGLAFLPIYLTLLLALNTLNRLSSWIERYWMAMLGLLLVGVCLILLPIAKSQVQLILPTAFIGLGIGLVDCSLLPQLGDLVDLRHKSVYGTVYALSQSAFCLALVIGSPLSGILAADIGFQWTLSVFGIVCILYVPSLYYLRNPTRKEEEEPLKGSI